MKKLFVALAMLFVIANAAAVTVSITATNNGNTVSVQHYYSANGDASYKAEGKGKVSYGSVDVDENFNANGKAQNGSVIVNHLAVSKDYSITSSHVTTGEEETNTISENGNINAGDENGKMSKDVSDEGYAESVMVAAKKNNALAYSFYTNYGNVSGKQSVATGSASASQSLEFSDFGYALTVANKDSNGDGLYDEGAESEAFCTIITGQVSVMQLATTSNSVSTSQSLNAVGSGLLQFTSIAVKDTDYDYKINEYAQAGTYNVDHFDEMNVKGTNELFIYSGTLNAETSASTSNSASTSMKFNLKDESGQSDIEWLGLTAARDNDNDGTIDERTDTYVDGNYIYQFNANGYAKVSDTGNKEESYMEGYGKCDLGWGHLDGYANANSGVAGESRSIDIDDIDFWLKAWIDENGDYHTDSNPSP